MATEIPNQEGQPHASLTELHTSFQTSLKEAVNSGVGKEESRGRVYIGPDTNFISALGVGTTRLHITSGHTTGAGSDQVFTFHQVVLDVSKNTANFSSGRIVVEEVEKTEKKEDDDGNVKIVKKRTKENALKPITKGILEGTEALLGGEHVLQDLKSRKPIPTESHHHSQHQ